ncbi:HPP family protein [Streptomyces sp. TP-A0874]|uniref:HPP family protein n=1 Tax=Streptomyces sp. TP-A0874 TaxID=549819 RepID=UPI00085326FD|nr:HPP family protein [Streptomyces sp. TP-A0874]
MRPRTRPAWVAGIRLLVLAAVTLTAVGLVGHAAGGVWLTTTLGPTAYLLLVHPGQEASRLRSSLLGHAAATGSGLACLAIFGLWDNPSIAETHHDTLPQIGAQALSVGVTLLLLTLLKAHHPPAAATTLLITSGIARPGAPLYGMLAGLALLIALAAVMAHVPGAQEKPGEGGHREPANS